jgi:hypothetical protein
LAFWRRMPWVENDPSWRRSLWFKALVRSRADVEADELDNKAEHHQTDSDVLASAFRRGEVVVGLLSTKVPS